MSSPLKKMTTTIATHAPVRGMSDITCSRNSVAPAAVHNPMATCAAESPSHFPTSAAGR